MKASEFLENARCLPSLIESTYEMIERLTPPKSTLNNNGNGKNSYRENTEQDKQIRRYELKKKAEDYADKLLVYRSCLVNLVTEGTISPRSKMIIQQRYILVKPWKEIAAFADLSEAQIKRMNEDAVAEVATQPDFWCHAPKI